jgi:hypothetical protein
MEYYNTGGDVGAVWTGLDGSNRRVYFDRLVMTGIHTNNVPVSYSLSQNYPNPFNPVTKIDYSIAQRGVVKIQVYDILGRNVAVLVNSELNPGSYSVNFDATGLSSGIYFYRMTSGDFISTKKMVILK